MKRINQDISGVVKMLVKGLQDSYGFEKDPEVIADTNEHTAPDGYFYYAIKAIGGDVTINAVKDLSGNAISGLATKVIQQGDVLYYPLSSIDLSGGTAVAYLQAKLTV